MRALALTVVLLLGCSTVSSSTSRPRLSGALDTAHASGLPITDPLRLEPWMREQIVNDLDNSGNERTRMRRIEHYLLDSTQLGFQYEPNLSLPAAQAFVQRRGDCVTFSQLMMAIARTLGIEAHFVRVTEAPHFYERGGAFFVSTHLAVAIGVGSDTTVYDLGASQSEWRRLALYHDISDETAFALYLGNLGVDRILAGKTDDARRMLEFALRIDPRLPELYGDLAIALTRAGDSADALNAVARGLAIDPAHRPLYVNGAVAARRAGQVALATRYEGKARALGADPVLLYTLGVRAFESGQFAVAAGDFERAVDREPDSVTLLAWLVRSEELAGRRAEAVDAFGRLRALAPHDAATRQLAASFPSLTRKPPHDLWPLSGPRFEIPLHLMPPGPPPAGSGGRRPM